MQAKNNPYQRFGEETSQPAVVITASTNQRQPREQYQFHLHKFGIVEIGLGCVVSCICIASIVTQSITDRTHGRHVYGGTYVSPGLWCGVFLFLSGSLGIKAKNNSSVGIYTANMVASILAALMMSGLLALSLMCSLFNEIIYLADAYVRAMHNTNAVLAFAAFIVCVIHSAYCCGGLCCIKNSKTVVYATQPSRQFAQLASGQYMNVPENIVVTNP